MKCQFSFTEAKTKGSDALKLSTGQKKRTSSSAFSIQQNGYINKTVPQMMMVSTQVSIPLHHQDYMILQHVPQVPSNWQIDKLENKMLQPAS